MTGERRNRRLDPLTRLLVIITTLLVCAVACELTSILAAHLGQR
jgi:hypothetical protein